jgi:hypothetical protein
MPLRLLLILSSMLTLVSCNDSALYNPSLVLPGAPLRRQQFELSSGVNLLPQVRPDVTMRYLELGAQGSVRYAITDEVTGSLNVWRSLTTPTENGARWGLTAAALFSFEITDGIKSAIIPMYQFTYIEQYLQGEGAAICYAVWPWSNRSISTYLAAAPFIGWPSGFTSMYGYGGIVSMGSVFHLSTAFDLTLEMGGVMQVNTFDDATIFLPTPSATLVWRVN